MSKDLSVLGQELCQEFDDRLVELKKLGFEIQVDLKKHRDELNHQKKFDISERLAEKLRQQTEVKALLISYGQDRRMLSQTLEETRKVQTRELKSWLEESMKHLETWQKSVRYIHKKC
ncbi:MAG: hypothetical protein ACYDEJ_02225 [Desulfitobacteriaceae bacterium]